MAPVQSKSSKIVVISCLALFFLIALQFQPLQAQSDDCPTGNDGKTSWPELVGVAGCEAAAKIKAENSGFNPIVLPEGTGVPRNFDCRRVFVYISGNQGLVSKTPSSG